MTNSQPLVYIILLNYNGYKDTIDCIRSLEKIYYKNYEVIIVDNASTNNSEDILKKELSNYKIIQSGQNIGFSGGNNIGIKIALENNADYVLLLNNDTVVEENFLTELVNNAETEENVGITISKILYFKEKNKIWYAGGGVTPYLGKPFHIGINDIDHGQYDDNKYVDFATGCCSLIKKEVFEKVGFLGEEFFLYYEDTDFSSRVISKGYNILYCPKSVIYHKVSSSTGETSYLSQYYNTRNRCIYIKKNIQGYRKIMAFIYFFAFTFVRGFFKKQNSKAILNGIVDFFNNKYGKTI